MLKQKKRKMMTTSELILAYHNADNPSLQKRIKKIKKIIWISIPVTVGIGILLSILLNNEIIGISLAMITLLNISVLMFLFNKKFYNNFGYLILIALVGMFFKLNHWPGAGIILTISLLLSAIGFWFNSMMSLTILKNNKFLRFFGFAINLILALSFLGALFKIQHWAGAGYMAFYGTILFLLSILSLVFTLPNSNYIEWTAFHKKYFFRSIIIPMSFMFLVTLQVLFLPNFWGFLYFGTDFLWGMEEIELLDKIGLN
ncbi:MAG: hypothetical protein R6V23_01805 [Bacteroidales bacterium]